MDPEECTNAAPLGTGWHPGRHLEVRKTRPDAGLVDTEYCEVFRLHLGNVRFVCDGQGASLDVAQPGGVVLCGWRARARVVAVLDVPSRIRREESCGTLVTCNLCRGRLACRKLEEVTIIRRVIEMSVEPPLVKGVVD